MRFFKELLLICAMMFIWPLAGQANQQVLSPPKSIAIATFSKALGNSPFHIAQHFKWFEEDPALKGVTIIYKTYNDRPSISDAFSSGELQVLFSADVPAILCRAQGNDISIVTLSANVAQNILVRKELPIKTVSDLKDKKLAVLQGTSSHYGLLKILKSAGLKENDLDLLYMNPAEAKVAFESDKIDAWAVWAPFVEQQEVSGKGNLISGGNAIINSVMSISNPFMNQNKASAKAIVKIIHRAKKWIITHPKEAQDIIAQELNLDPLVVKTAWPKHNWSAKLNPQIVKDIQDKATFLGEADKTRQGKILDVKKELIDVRFVWFRPK